MVRSSTNVKQHGSTNCINLYQLRLYPMFFIISQKASAHCRKPIFKHKERGDFQCMHSKENYQLLDSADLRDIWEAYECCRPCYIALKPGPAPTWWRARCIRNWSKLQSCNKKIIVQGTIQWFYEALEVSKITHLNFNLQVISHNLWLWANFLSFLRVWQFWSMVWYDSHPSILKPFYDTFMFGSYL